MACLPWGTISEKLIEQPVEGDLLGVDPIRAVAFSEPVHISGTEPRVILNPQLTHCQSKVEMPVRTSQSTHIDQPGHLPRQRVEQHVARTQIAMANDDILGGGARSIQLGEELLTRPRLDPSFVRHALGTGAQSDRCQTGT